MNTSEKTILDDYKLVVEAYQDKISFVIDELNDILNTTHSAVTADKVKYILSKIN